MPAGPPIPFTKLVKVLLVVAALVLVFRIATEDSRETTSAASSNDPRVTASASVPASPRVRPSSEPDPLPKCGQGDERARLAGFGDWASTLIDTRYDLKPSYAPPDLVSVEEAGFEAFFQVRSVVIHDLTALREAAEDAASPVGIAAAYRSYYTQDSLFRRRIQTEGHTMARVKTARAGHSEHQLGTTIDFKTAGALDVDSSWEATPAGKWMAANAWKYGFVMSYPAGRTRQTCYWYEPWHYRYFGTERAKKIHDSGLTVREYLWKEQH
jgi:D-alanyl-D-alanine carboxypeptidase